MLNLKKVRLPNGVELRNPIVMAPMTTQLSFYNGEVTKDEIEYYENRSHDIGAVITAAANVQEIGKGWHGELGIYDDRFIPGLRKLANAIKSKGAKAIVQIFHAGRMTSSKVLNGKQPVSASAVKSLREGAEVPRDLESEEILQVFEDFKLATVRAIKAGFDGVEIHGANTYLIQQMYSAHSNRREDEWGGSREKRFKFIDELVDGVIATVKENAENPFIVGYRFSPEEFEEPGLRMEDTFYLVDKLSVKELDYLHLSTNEYDRVSVEKEYADKPIIDYVVDTVNGRIPVLCPGGVETAEDVENVLSKADMVVVGRSLIHDPRWGQKILNGEKTAILSELGIDEQALRNKSLWDYVHTLRLDK